MDDLTISALLLNFGALAGASIMRRPTHRRSAASLKLGPLLIALGTLAAFASLGLLFYSLGLVQGLLYWCGSAIAFSLLPVILQKWDGLITVGGLSTIALGCGLAIYRFL